MCESVWQMKNGQLAVILCCTVPVENKTHTSLEQCVTENSSFIFKPWTPAHSE